MNQHIAEDIADQDLAADFTSVWASVLLDLDEKDRRPAVADEPTEATNAGDEDFQPDG